MQRPSITQAIIDANYPETVEIISENCLDGVGIPYYNEPEPESDVERERR